MRQGVGGLLVLGDIHVAASSMKVGEQMKGDCDKL